METHYMKQTDNGFDLYIFPRITTSTADNIQLVLSIAVTWPFLLCRSFGPLLCWDYSKRR